LFIAAGSGNGSGRAREEGGGRGVRLFMVGGTRVTVWWGSRSRSASNANAGRGGSLGEHGGGGGRKGIGLDSDPLCWGILFFLGIGHQGTEKIEKSFRVLRPRIT